MKNMALKEPLKEVSFLGKGTVLEGKMTFQGELRLGGKFDGEIYESGMLIVAETAALKGKFKVQAIAIRGLVEGEVDARERVDIYREGKFFGNLFTPIITIEESGIFEGNLKRKETDK